MTVKELKEIINNIDEKYDNEKVIIDEKIYSDYGNDIIEVELDKIDFSYFSLENSVLPKGYYMHFISKD